MIEAFHATLRTSARGLRPKAKEMKRRILQEAGAENNRFSTRQPCLNVGNHALYVINKSLNSLN